MSREVATDRFDLSSEAVRSRFRWALRQGNPTWLWPDMTLSGWKAALCQIERATRQVLTEDRANATLAGNAEDIGIAAFTSGMGPLLGYWTKVRLLHTEPPVRSVLELHYWHNCERNRRLARFAVEAVVALANAGVEVTVLKGMHTAYSRFPDPGTRPMSDIDLLIEADDEPIAAEVLRTLGYQAIGASLGEQSWRMSGTAAVPCSLSLVHRDGPWCIDLHTSLDRRYSAGAPIIRLDRALRSRIAQPWPLSPKAHVLAGRELVLHLAVHAGLRLSSMTMLRLSELIFVIRDIEEESSAFWERFLGLAEQTGNAGSTYPALFFANRLVPGTVPVSVLQALKQDTTASVRRVVGRLTPATCHNVQRCTFEERFMWTRTIAGWARELLFFLFPPNPIPELCRIYTMRFWRLARRTVVLRDKGARK